LERRHPRLARRRGGGDVRRARGPGWAARGRRDPDARRARPGSTPRRLRRDGGADRAPARPRRAVRPGDGVGLGGGRDAGMSDGLDTATDSAARTARLDQALAAIAGGAAGLDRAPCFPREAFFHLADAGALTATVGAARDKASMRPGWDLLRRVAAADASVGRILDGHQNAIERLEVAADPETRERELAAAAGGRRLLGVGGAVPGPGGGAPARLHEAGTGQTLRGAKTFCSGAGGVDAALVMVGADDGAAPSLVLVECGERVEVDRDWYRAAGLRASESHRV